MSFLKIPKAETAAGGVLKEKVFLEISQNLQENTSWRLLLQK